ncbi:hypothetical protein GE061_001566 [Apolygus lucorum]|uniref:Uncharacterized protein n=1 Tax=Apolygus lucorum TaxID=248454 RepID=A0A8S9Y7F4_APOLU|nr:hypothetical protein GE061_001566 [Apolygus lucorum]
MSACISAPVGSPKPTPEASPLLERGAPILELESDLADLMSVWSEDFDRTTGYVVPNPYYGRRRDPRDPGRQLRVLRHLRLPGWAIEIAGADRILQRAHAGRQRRRRARQARLALARGGQPPPPAPGSGSPKPTPEASPLLERGAPILELESVVPNPYYGRRRDPRDPGRQLRVLRHLRLPGWAIEIAGADRILQRAHAGRQRRRRARQARLALARGGQPPPPAPGSGGH